MKYLRIKVIDLNQHVKWKYQKRMVRPDLLVSIHMKINWFRKHLGKFWNLSSSPISTTICAASDQTATAMEL